MTDKLRKVSRIVLEHVERAHDALNNFRTDGVSPRRRALASTDPGSRAPSRARGPAQGNRAYRADEVALRNPSDVRLHMMPVALAPATSATDLRR